MRAKLLTISAAIAGLLALPAVAGAQAKVTVYGHAHVSVDMMNADSSTSADNGDKINVTSNSSRLGVKAVADLGGGLKGIAQYEVIVSADGEGSGVSSTVSNTVSPSTTTVSSTVSTSNSTLFGAARNSFVGLQGGFGTILAGIHDTPLKSVGRAVEFFPEYIGDARNLTEQDLRPNNVVAYSSPSFGGVGVNLAYVVDEDANASKDAYSGSVTYTGGPIWAGLAYESFKNPAAYYKTLYRLAAQYKAGPVRVAGQYQQGADKANVTGADRMVYGLGASYTIGSAVIKGQYYAADSADNKTASGATMYAIGADYNLGKQTTVYAAYASTDNDTNGSFAVNAGGHGDSITPKAGTGPSGFSIGMIQKF